MFVDFHWFVDLFFMLCCLNECSKLVLKSLLKFDHFLYLSEKAFGLPKPASRQLVHGGRRLVPRGGDPKWQYLDQNDRDKMFLILKQIIRKWLVKIRNLFQKPTVSKIEVLPSFQAFQWKYKRGFHGYRSHGFHWIHGLHEFHIFFRSHGFDGFRRWINIFHLFDYVFVRLSTLIKSSKSSWQFCDFVILINGWLDTMDSIIWVDRPDALS